MTDEARKRLDEIKKEFCSPRSQLSKDDLGFFKMDPDDVFWIFEQLEQAWSKNEDLFERHNQQIDRLLNASEELKQQAEMLAGALEKYADKKNWRYISNNDVGAFDAYLDFKPDHFCKTTQELGGYTAREALAKYRGEK